MDMCETDVVSVLYSGFDAFPPVGKSEITDQGHLRLSCIVVGDPIYLSPLSPRGTIYMTQNIHQAS